MSFTEMLDQQAQTLRVPSTEDRTRPRFRPGVLSVDHRRDRFDLITPGGARLRLNPHLNRASLMHLEGQPVSVLLRPHPWPMERPNHAAPLRPVSRKVYDVLFVEALDEPLEIDVTDLDDVATDRSFYAGMNDDAFTSR